MTRSSGVCHALYSSNLVYKQYSHANDIVLMSLSILSIFMIILLSCWIMKREQLMSKGDVDGANKQFIYIYKYMIYFYMLIIGLQGLCMIIYVSCIEIGNIPSDNIILQILHSLIIALPNAQIGLVLFSFTKNTLSLESLLRGIKFTIPYTILCFVANLISIWDEKASSIVKASVDMIFFFSCLYVLCRQCQYEWKRRNIILRYIVCVLILCSFDGISQIYTSNTMDGYCIQQIGLYLWYILYPIIFFLTVKYDSDYHWMNNAKPLVSSTQNSLGDLDLFLLPGYSTTIQHYNYKKKRNNSYVNEINNTDIQFRFRKLKQIISGYIKIIPFTKIKFDNNSKIGSGSTSKVFKGNYRGKLVAVKSLLRLDKKTNMSWTDLTLIFRESILSSSIKHPFIVRFIGASLTYNCFYLIYEYCEYGDLQQIVIENMHGDNNILIKSVKQRYYYLCDICSGMIFIHDHGYVHRDLKTANVVVSFSTKKNRYIAKICDFGVSRKLTKENIKQMKVNSKTFSYGKGYQSNNNKEMYLNSDDIPNTVINESITSSVNYSEISRTIHVGTPAFLAPEILLKLVQSKGLNLQKEYNKKLKKQQNNNNNNNNDNSNGDFKHKLSSSKLFVELSKNNDKNTNPSIYCDYATDVYSYGMIMWSLITKKLPYKGFKPLDMILMIYSSERLNIDDTYWNEWKSCNDINIDIKQMKNLIESCWAQYPSQRPTFKQIAIILKHINIHKYNNNPNLDVNRNSVAGLSDRNTIIHPSYDTVTNITLDSDETSFTTSEAN